MSRIAIVTGAGSGVGRAVVQSLAGEGWNVALIGRSADALNETMRAASAGQSKLAAFACDVADRNAVAQIAKQIAQTLGDPTVLVNSAGTNVPNRAIDVLSVEDFDRMIATNLNGAFYCVHAFLPAMRRAGGGTIVNIVSDAGIAANAKAGGGYAASKFGLRGLTQAINAEQRGHGIRACAVCPGDINTPILNKRPAPPSAEARLKMLQPEDVAQCAMLAINLPPRVIVEEMLVRPA